MYTKNLSLLLITSIVLFIFGSSFYFGYKYAVFNTDFHHYSITLEPFLDFKNGHTHTHKMLHLKIHLMAFEQKADNFTEKNQIKK